MKSFVQLCVLFTQERLKTAKFIPIDLQQKVMLNRLCKGEFDFGHVLPVV